MTLKGAEWRFLFLNTYIGNPFTSFCSKVVNDCYHLKNALKEKMKTGANAEVCL